MDFSVVIPTYNSSASLVRALEALSFISEEINLETIVIDDASLDGTEEIVRTYESRLDLRYVRNRSNSGAAYSRNLGVEKATFNNIVFNDCDDISLLSRFESHGRHLVKHPNNLSFVTSIKRYGNREVVYGIGDCEDLNYTDNQYVRYILLGESIKTGPNLHFPCATMAVTKDLFTKLGGFDVSLKRNEDADLIIRALKMGASISTSSVLGVIRESGNSPHQRGKSNLAGELGLLERYGKDHLTRSERKSAIWWFKAKAEYFERNYLTAIRFLFISGLFRPSRILHSMTMNFPRRLSHDLRNFLKR